MEILALTHPRSVGPYCWLGHTSVDEAWRGDFVEVPEESDGDYDAVGCVF